MINREYINELMNKSIKDYEIMNPRQFRAMVLVICTELIKKYDELEKFKLEKVD